MGRAGRKSKAGKRKPCGRLLSAKAWDYGNDRVVAMREKFPKAPPEQLYDAIGRAWARGLLDCADDPAGIRDIGREYAELYWHWLREMDARIGGSERSGGKAILDDSPDRRELRFNRLDEGLTGEQRRAVHQLVVNCYGSDDGPLWLGRLMIDRWDADGLAHMNLAIAGLSAMIYGTKTILRRCA